MQHNAPVSRHAELGVALQAGDYTLVIKGGGEGTPANGFSNYSSVGFYAIEGTLTGPSLRDPVAQVGSAAWALAGWGLPAAAGFPGPAVARVRAARTPARAALTRAQVARAPALRERLRQGPEWALPARRAAARARARVRAARASGVALEQALERATAAAEAPERRSGCASPLATNIRRGKRMRVSRRRERALAHGVAPRSWAFLAPRASPKSTRVAFAPVSSACPAGPSDRARDRGTSP